MKEHSSPWPHSHEFQNQAKLIDSDTSQEDIGYFWGVMTRREYKRDSEVLVIFYLDGPTLYSLCRNSSSSSLNVHAWNRIITPSVETLNKTEHLNIVKVHETYHHIIRLSGNTAPVPTSIPTEPSQMRSIIIFKGILHFILTWFYPTSQQTAITSQATMNPDQTLSPLKERKGWMWGINSESQEDWRRSAPTWHWNPLLRAAFRETAVGMGRGGLEESPGQESGVLVLSPALPCFMVTWARASLLWVSAS